MEIRSWAFFSLLSKLECGIISLQQLTENEDLISKLVQWMKHDKCTQREKILDLLYSLVKVKHYWASQPSLEVSMSAL
jgi:hypothetical protein